MDMSMKNFTLHFDMAEQCDSLDRSWFGKTALKISPGKVGRNNTQQQTLTLNKAIVNQSYASLSHKSVIQHMQCYALLNSGATHVLLPGHMLPRGARSFKVIVNLAVGKEKARCWRNEVYAEDTEHIHFYL